jgi:hypothetical protein
MANISERRAGCLMKNPLSGKNHRVKSAGFFDTAQLRIFAQLCSALEEGNRAAIPLHSLEFSTIKYRIDVVKAPALPTGNCSKFATKPRLTAQQNVESGPHGTPSRLRGGGRSLASGVRLSVVGPAARVAFITLKSNLQFFAALRRGLVAGRFRQQRRRQSMSDSTEGAGPALAAHSKDASTPRHDPASKATGEARPHEGGEALQDLLDQAVDFVRAQPLVSVAV